MAYISALRTAINTAYSGDPDAIKRFRKKNKNIHLMSKQDQLDRAWHRWKNTPEFKDAIEQMAGKPAVDPYLSKAEKILWWSFSAGFNTGYSRK